MKKRYTEEKVVNQHETDIKVDAASSELRPKRAYTGATGCGKTYLACAPGEQACRQNKKVRYYRLGRRMEALKLGHADGRYLK